MRKMRSSTRIIKSNPKYVNAVIVEENSIPAYKL